MKKHAQSHTRSKQQSLQQSPEAQPPLFARLVCVQTHTYKPTLRGTAEGLTCHQGSEGQDMLPGLADPADASMGL